MKKKDKLVKLINRIFMKYIIYEYLPEARTKYAGIQVKIHYSAENRSNCLHHGPINIICSTIFRLNKHFARRSIAQQQRCVRSTEWVLPVQISQISLRFGGHEGELMVLVIQLLFKLYLIIDYNHSNFNSFTITQLSLINGLKL